MEIKHIDNEKNGVFEIYEGDVKAGFMTYVWAGDTKFIIDHTEADSAFGGRGVGKKLVMAGVEFAREKGVEIMPLCPFAKAVFDKTPEIHDVIF